MFTKHIKAPHYRRKTTTLRNQTNIYDRLEGLKLKLMDITYKGKQEGCKTKMVEVRADAKEDFENGLTLYTDFITRCIT